jgi:hypothetical protein
MSASDLLLIDRSAKGPTSQDFQKDPRACLMPCSRVFNDHYCKTMLRDVIGGLQKGMVPGWFYDVHSLQLDFFFLCAKPKKTPASVLVYDGRLRF